MTFSSTSENNLNGAWIILCRSEYHKDDTLEFSLWEKKKQNTRLNSVLEQVRSLGFVFLMEYILVWYSNSS